MEAGGSPQPSVGTEGSSVTVCTDVLNGFLLQSPSSSLPSPHQGSGNGSPSDQSGGELEARLHAPDLQEQEVGFVAGASVLTWQQQHQHQQPALSWRAVAADVQQPEGPSLALGQTVVDGSHSVAQSLAAEGSLPYIHSTATLQGIGRTFLPCSARLAGLESGDVVILLRQGQPHAALPSARTTAHDHPDSDPSSQAAAGTLHEGGAIPALGTSGLFVLELLPPSTSTTASPDKQGQGSQTSSQVAHADSQLSRPSARSSHAQAPSSSLPAVCYLEVIRQGPYIGLRSPAAGWRFLQPRKRAPHRLVFFNVHCGIWEQWEPVGAGLADPWGGLPWAQLPVVLRSRRLPHVTLSGDLLRVGTYEPLRLQEAGLPLPLAPGLLPPGLGSGDKHTLGGDVRASNNGEAGDGGADASTGGNATQQGTPAAAGAGKDDDDAIQENEDTLLLSAPPPVMYPSPGFGYDFGGAAGPSPMPPAVAVSSPSFGQEAPYGATGFRVGGDAAGAPGRLFAGLDAATLSPPRRPGSTTVGLGHQLQQQGGLGGLGVGGGNRSAAGSVVGAEGSQSWGPGGGGVSGELGEDENLRRISRFLVTEWVRFVDVEKASRAEVERQLAELIAQLRALRDDALGQVDALRSEMSAEVVSLFNIVRAREAQLASAKATRRRIVTAAVTALWRCRALEVQAAVIQDWLNWAATRRAHRALVERSRARSSAGALAAGFAAWQAFAATAAHRRVLVVRGIMRTSSLKQGAAFSAWKGLTESRKQARSILTTLALSQFRSCLQSSFSAWHSLTAVLAAGRAEAQHRGARRDVTLLRAAWIAWEGLMTHALDAASRVVTFSAKRQHHWLSKVLQAWWQATCEAKRLAAAEAAVAERHRGRLKERVLSDWQQRVRHTKAVQAILERRLRAVQRRVVAGVMQAWHHAAQLSRAYSLLVTRADAKRAIATKAAVFSVLRDAAIVGRFHRRCLTLAKHSRVTRVLHAWRAVCQSHAAARQMLRGVGKQLAEQGARQVLRSWAGVVEQRVQHRLYKVQGMQPSTRAALTMGLARLWQQTTSVVVTCESQSASHMHSTAASLVRQGQVEDIIASRSAAHESAGAASATSHDGNPDQQTPADGSLSLPSVASDPATADAPTGAASSSSSTVGQRNLEQQSQQWRWLGQCALHAWHQAAQHRAVQQRVVAHHLAAKARHTKQQILAAWRGVVSVQVAARQQAELLGHQSDARLVGTVLTEWQAVASARKVQARRVSRLRLHQVFRRWLLLTRHLQAQADALQEAITERRQRAVLLMWQKRCKESHSEKQHEARAERRASVWHSRYLLRAGLHELWSHAQRARDLRVKVARGLLNTTSAIMRRCLLSWHQAAAYQASLRRRAARLLSSHKHRTLHAAMAAWLWAQRKSQEVAAHAEAVCATRRTATALAGWRQVTASCKAGRQLLEAVAVRSERHAKSAVLSAWGNITQHHKAAEAEAERRATHLVPKRVLSAAFSAWRDHMDSMADRRLHADHKGSLHDRRLLSACLLAWQAHTAAVGWSSAAGVAVPAAAREPEDSDFGAEAMGLGMRDIGAHGLRSSLQLGAQAPSVLSVLAHQQAHRRLRSALRAWAAAVRHRAWREQAVAALRGRHVHRTMRSVLATWSMLAELMRAQRVSLLRADRRRRLRVLKAAFAQWKRVTEETKRRTEVLKACIKRKKVAFQLFKNWYWEAFDADVQETIRAMFRSTEQEVHSHHPSPEHHRVSADANNNGAAPAAHLAGASFATHAMGHDGPAGGVARSGWAPPHDMFGYDGYGASQGAMPAPPQALYDSSGRPHWQHQQQQQTISAHPQYLHVLGGAGPAVSYAAGAGAIGAAGAAHGYNHQQHQPNYGHAQHHTSYTQHRYHHQQQHLAEQHRVQLMGGQSEVVPGSQDSSWGGGQGDAALPRACLSDLGTVVSGQPMWEQHAVAGPGPAPVFAAAAGASMGSPPPPQGFNGSHVHRNYLFNAEDSGGADGQGPVALGGAVVNGSMATAMYVEATNGTSFAAHQARSLSSAAGLAAVAAGAYTTRLGPAALYSSDEEEESDGGEDGRYYGGYKASSDSNSRQQMWTSTVASASTTVYEQQQHTVINARVGVQARTELRPFDAAATVAAAGMPAGSGTVNAGTARADGGAHETPQAQAGGGERAAPARLGSAALHHALGERAQ